MANVTITDLQFVKVKQGTGLRCTLNIGAVASITGCLACRDSKNQMVFLTPAAKGGRGRSFRNVTLAPEVNGKLVDLIERRFGDKIERNDPVGSTAIPIQAVNPHYERSLDLVE